MLALSSSQFDPRRTLIPICVPIEHYAPDSNKCTFVRPVAVLDERSGLTASTAARTSAIDTQDTPAVGCHGLLGSLDDAS